MKKAFTVTIEKGSRIGKAVFSATDHKDVRRQFALMQSNDLNLKGFSIVKIQENEKPQRSHVSSVRPSEAPWVGILTLPAKHSLRERKKEKRS